MREYLKDIKVGDVFLTEFGWWVKILEISNNIAEGFFGNTIFDLNEIGGYHAKWDLNEDGREVTDPNRPPDGTRLGEPIALPLYL